MKKYIVNEVFYTLQGEGFHSGKAAVFCRFSRCNLWTGREEDRFSAICQFCDTDFLHGEKYTLDELVDLIDCMWLGDESDKFVVFTGGEPLLQLDEKLIWQLRDLGFYVAVETNGTCPVPDGINWLCVSPKAGTQLRAQYSDELKLVFPQPALMPQQLASYQCDHRWLSPMDGPDLEQNIKSAVDYVLANTSWRVNIQSHKVWGIR